MNIVPNFSKTISTIYKDNRGVVHILPLVLILVGIISGVYLVQKEGFQIFRPQAASESIELQDGSCVNIKNGKKVLTCGNIKLKLNSPLDKTTDTEINKSIIKTAHAADNSLACTDILIKKNNNWESVSGKNITIGTSIKSEHITFSYNQQTTSPSINLKSDNNQGKFEISNTFYTWTAPDKPGSYKIWAEMNDKKQEKCQFTFVVTNQNPVNAYPQKQVNLTQNDKVTFTWFANDSTNPTKYDLWVDKNGKWVKYPNITASTVYNLKGGTKQLAVSEFENGKTYNWWVDAFEDDTKIGTSIGTPFTINITPVTTDPKDSKVAPAGAAQTSTQTPPQGSTNNLTTTESQNDNNFKITLCGTEMTLGQAKSEISARGYKGATDVVSVANEYLKVMCPGSQNDCSLEPNFPEILSETPKVGDTEYIWVANCNRACLRNNSTGNEKDLMVDPNPNDPAACPKNYSDGNVNPATSNWCYGFKDGNRCMVLWSKNKYEEIKKSGGSPFDVGNSPQNTSIKTASYRIAEKPLTNVSETEIPFKSYTPGIVVDYSFTNLDPGNKFIFAQFKDSQGKIVDSKPLSIELIKENAQPTSCVVNVTECSCGNANLNDTRNPGNCSPECGGGWCKGDSRSSKGGYCATCKP